MSVDLLADETDSRISAEEISSNISREGPDTYTAVHVLDIDDTCYEIQRKITQSDGSILLTQRWLKGDVELREVSKERVADNCIGDGCPSLTLIGFVCSEHFNPSPKDQFESVLAIIQHNEL